MKTSEFTTAEYDKIMELMSLCKEYECFTFEGLVVKGSIVDLVKKYVKQNPSKKFGTWLIDNKYNLDI